MNKAVESSAPLAVAIGMFDGVHAGHRHLLAQLKSVAGERGMVPGVVTFRSHPTCVLTPDCPVPLISTSCERETLLRAEGIGRVVMLDFNDELRALTSREFMLMLRVTYGVRTLLVGFNHHFGSDRSHGFTDYHRIGREIGVEVVLATEVPGAKVSSSIIRRLIAAGQVEKAGALLGRPCRLEGEVVAGRQLGRTIGFPTANVRPLHPELILPGSGVYAARVTVEGDSEVYGAMVNIGWRPTVNSDMQDVTIEAHLLDFSGDIYGKKVRVELPARIRDEHRFPSVEELRLQLTEDVKSARALLM